MPTNLELHEEVKIVREDIKALDVRVTAVEKSQIIMQTTLNSMLGILKFIAGITAVIAAGIILDFIRRG
jgi:hypothetical protein